MEDHNEDTNPMTSLDDDAVPSVVVANDESEVSYHPIRGALYGLLLGIGVAIYLIILKVISLSLVIPIIVIIVCIGLGAVWGRFGPPKSAKAAT